MKYLPIPYRILFGGSPEAQRRAQRGIRRNPKHLKGMCAGTALVGVVAGGIDVLVRDTNHPAAFTHVVQDVIDTIPHLLAVAHDVDGNQLHFMKTVGAPAGTYGALSVLSEGCWVELPGSIRPGDTESHLTWMPQGLSVGDAK